MSLEDLEKTGLLRPRDQWGKVDPATQVSQPPLIVATLLALVGAALMALGNGQTLTWVGLGVFFLGLFGFTWLSLRGIRGQPTVPPAPDKAERRF